MALVYIININMKIEKGYIGQYRYRISYSNNIGIKEGISMWWYRFSKVIPCGSRHAIETYVDNVSNGVLVSFKHEGENNYD